MGYLKSEDYVSKSHLVNKFNVTTHKEFPAVSRKTLTNQVRILKQDLFRSKEEATFQIID